MPRGIKNGALALATACIALACAEVGLRLVADPDSYIRRPLTTRVFIPNPDYLPGVVGEAGFVVNEIGLRGDPLPARPVTTVVVLGGSSTECTYLDTGEAWPAVLQGMLAEAGRSVWVGNGGVSGISVRHHLVQQEAILSALPEVDVIVVMAGVNDLLRYLQRREPELDWDRDPRARMRVHYESFELPARPDFGPGYERTELTRLARLSKERLKKLFEPDWYAEVASDGRSYATWRTARATGRVSDELPELGSALDAYRRDLRTMAEASEAHGSQLVLVTQPALWQPQLLPRLEALLWMGAVDSPREGADTYYSAGALAQGLHQFNATLLEVCSERALRCLDLARLVPSDTSAFYDDVHFNESGARLVAGALSANISLLLRE